MGGKKKIKRKKIIREKSILFSWALEYAFGIYRGIKTIDSRTRAAVVGRGHMEIMPSVAVVVVVVVVGGGVVPVRS